MSLINQFFPISIETLNEKNLLTNRQDRKFVLSSDLFDLLMEKCSLHYDVLEIDGVRDFAYTTTYYDTEALDMYHQHQRGKKSRYKIRKRVYNEAGTSFIEVKIKNNKDRTLKFRTKGSTLNDAFSLISEHTPYSTAELHETMKVSYQRITLLHKLKNEKITIDRSLVFEKDGHKIKYKRHIFAEVKTADAHNIEFCQIMKSIGIRPESLSKYCLGVVSFLPHIKQNNFKVSLKNILKQGINDMS